MKKVRTAALVVVALATLVLVGCFNVTPVPLEIVSITPEPGAQDVPVDIVISIVASANLDPVTVTVDSVQLHRGGAGDPVVPAAVAVESTSITVTPDADLAYSTQYTLVIAGSVADSDGVTLAGEVSGSFTTEAAFEVASVSPPDGGAGALIDASIIIQTSRELDATTVTSDTVQLQDTAVVPASLSVSGSTISLTPDAVLDFGAEYTVFVDETVADEEGEQLGTNTTTTFSTRYLTVSVSTTGGDLVQGAAISVDESPAGSTDVAGELPLSVASGGTLDVSAVKTFFIEASEAGVPLDGTTYDVQLELAPYIYVPTRPEGGGIARLDSVDAEPATWDEIFSIDYGIEQTHGLGYAIYIYTDYENGLMYVLDASWESDLVTLIRMTDFPPAANGSDAEVVELAYDPDELYVYGAQQLAVLDDGSIMLFDTSLSFPGQFRLINVPQNLEFTTAQVGVGTFFSGPNPPEYDAMGLSQLPDGSFLVTGGDHSTIFAGTLDGVDDTTIESFGSLTYGTGDNNLAYPTRTVVSPDGSYVYISDTGYRFATTPPPDDNSRIVRVDTSGNGFTSYGGPGTGVDQFDGPVILGLLPDNKLYIMDVDNDRLVRIDPGVFDGGAADWTESDPTANFNFDYWYNYS